MKVVNWHGHSKHVTMQRLRRKALPLGPYVVPTYEKERAKRDAAVALFRSIALKVEKRIGEEPEMLWAILGTNMCLLGGHLASFPLKWLEQQRGQPWQEI